MTKDELDKKRNELWRESVDSITQGASFYGWDKAVEMLWPELEKLKYELISADRSVANLACEAARLEEHKETIIADVGRLQNENDATFVLGNNNITISGR